MDFIVSSVPINLEWDCYKANGLNIFYQKGIHNSERDIYCDSELAFVVGDTNIGFIKAVGSTITIAEIKKNILRLRNGFLLFYDKISCVLTIYTDIFGIFQLFYLDNPDHILISSDYNQLLTSSKKQSDELAVLDILLFNYTLLDRTLLLDIKRIKGGSELHIKGKSIELKVLNNFADNFISGNENYKLDLLTYQNILRNNLEEDLIHDTSNLLTMTAGFDSRVLLALSKNIGLNIETVTFGQAGNIEQETIKDFINDFSQEHEFIKLDKNFQADIESITMEFLSSNLDNPVILDIPHYILLNRNHQPSNLIAGFMGGEIMSGQSIGSQVTFTESAAALLESENTDDLTCYVKSRLESEALIDQSRINEIVYQYCKSLECYIDGDKRINILRFILNESYAKFFGSVYKTLRNRFNIIVPFIDTDYISYILKSNISFLHKKPFVNNPFDNFKAKIFYSKSIKSLCPDLSETRFDRLYRVNDLCIGYRLPFAALGYIKSHLFRINKSKKRYPRPHHYDYWYRDFITKHLKEKPLNTYSKIFSDSFSLDINEYNALDSLAKKRYACATGINIALKRIIDL